MSLDTFSTFFSVIRYAMFGCSVLLPRVQALLWLLWPMLLFTSSSSSSNPTLWSTMVHVGRCRLFWLLGVARRLGESARRLGNWLGCSSESSRQSNASHDNEDDRRHSRSTNGLLGTCLDSVRSISSSGSVGSVLSGTWLWLRLMVSRLWSQGASWVRRARRRAQTTVNYHDYIDLPVRVRSHGNKLLVGLSKLRWTMCCTCVVIGLLIWIIC